MILQRLADLAAFDHVRYAQKACSNLAVLDLLRRHGALVDAVSAGEIRRALAAGYPVAGTPPPIVYTADIFDREALDLCVERDIHVNCGSPDMIEHSAAAPRAGRSRCGQSGLRPRPQPQDEHRRRSVEARHLARTARRLPGNGRPASGRHHRPAHAHRLGHRPGASVASLRGDGEAGRGRRPTVTSISAGGGLPALYRSGESYVDLAAYFALWDAARKRLEARFGHTVAWKSSPAATSWPRAAIW